MSDRKTPYVNGNRIGPDIAAIVAKHPRNCLVHYKGNWYKFMRCSCCKEEYWRQYGINSTYKGATTNPKQTYCSEACALKARRAKTRERQARWIAKNPEKAKAQHRASSRRWYRKYVNPRPKVRGQPL